MRRRSTAEPARVDIILDGVVRVRRLPPTTVERIREMGYPLQQSLDGLEIEFEASTGDGGGDLSNPSLIRLLQELSAEGVAFATDFRQAWSPADVVSQLLEDGMDFDHPQGVGYDGSNWWLHDLPASGH